MESPIQPIQSPLVDSKPNQEWLARLLWLFLPLTCLFLDGWSKLWVQQTLLPGGSREIIPGFFYLTLGYNPGAVFGSLSGLPPWARFLLFGVAGLAALIYFGSHFLAQQTPRTERIALGLILGGALGNGLDRLLHGHVVDFLDFVFGTWHYWAFNIADSCIVSGAILYALALLLTRPPKASAA